MATDDEKNSERIPANDNPWYWLATVYGEQPIDLHHDQMLRSKNRLAWNRWIASGINDETRNKLVEQGFDAAELVPFSQEERDDHYRSVVARSGHENIILPSPSDIPDFTLNTFEHDCYFESYIFPSVAKFARTIFRRTGTFSSAWFVRGAIFDSAIFDGGAIFESSIFADMVFFEGAQFAGITNFSSAEFKAGTAFNGAQFGNGGKFASTAFTGLANFTSVKFEMSTSFAYARFISGALFSSVTFRGGAIFHEASLEQDAHFSSAIFSGGANFVSAKFGGSTSFVNASFSSVTLFSKAQFEMAVPKLFGAALHEGTAWNDVKWPPPPSTKSTAQDQVYAYERLKQEMEKLKKHEDEQFFFRKELRARRGLVKPGTTYWILNYLYEVLSNYGYGVVRPVIGFFVLFAIGVASLICMPFGQCLMGVKMPFLDAASMSFANMLGAIPLKPLAHIKSDSLVWAAQIFAVFQTISGAILLFLLALALRNRFRLR